MIKRLSKKYIISPKNLQIWFHVKKMKKWNFEQWYANKSLEWKKAGIFPCKNGVWREKMEMKTSQVMASDCTRAADKRAWLESDCEGWYHCGRRGGGSWWRPKKKGSSVLHCYIQFWKLHAYGSENNHIIKVGHAVYLLIVVSSNQVFLSASS